MKKPTKAKVRKIKKMKDRFRELNPMERTALLVLVQNHLNSVSEISLHQDFRVSGYIDWLEKIEYELRLK